MLVQQLFFLLFVLLEDPLLRVCYLPLDALLEPSEDGVPGDILFGLRSSSLRDPVVVKGAAEGQSVILEGKPNPLLLFHNQF